MGEGCIPIRQISDWVDQTGFSGCREVEIFSNRYRSMPQEDWLNQICSAYDSLYA